MITLAKNAKAVNKKYSLNKAAQFFRDVVFELKKVHWPTRKQLFIYTGVVLVAVAVMGVLVWLVDSALSYSISNWILK